MYEAQITDYHCVPASLKRLLTNFFPEAKDLHQLDLGAMLGTDFEGTSISELFIFLDDIGLVLENITPNSALTKLQQHIPILLTYNDGPNSAHCSVAINAFKSGPYNEYFIVLDDPYYGKKIEIPLCTFKLLNPKFYLIRK